MVRMAVATMPKARFRLGIMQTVEKPNQIVQQRATHPARRRIRAAVEAETKRKDKSIIHQWRVTDAGYELGEPYIPRLRRTLRSCNLTPAGPSDRPVGSFLGSSRRAEALR